MRLISYDRESDIPYELSALNIDKTETGYEIVATVSGINDSDWTMGVYKTIGDARAEMARIHMALAGGRIKYEFWRTEVE